MSTMFSDLQNTAIDSLNIGDKITVSGREFTVRCFTGYTFGVDTKTDVEYVRVKVWNSKGKPTWATLRANRVFTVAQADESDLSRFAGV